MIFHFILCVIAGIVITAALLWGKYGLPYVKANPVSFIVQSILGIIAAFFFSTPPVQYLSLTALVVALGLAVANNKKV